MYFKKIDNNLSLSFLREHLLLELEDFKDTISFGCFYNNILVGVARYSINQCRSHLIDILNAENIQYENIFYLSGIYIKKDFRNKGIGRELTKLRLKDISNLNLNGIIISDIRETNSIKYNFKFLTKYKNPFKDIYMKVIYIRI